MKSNEKLLSIQSTQNNTSLNSTNHFKKNPNLIKKQISKIENQNSINSETPPSTQNGTDSDFLQDDNLNTSWLIDFLFKNLAKRLRNLHEIFSWYNLMIFSIKINLF